MNPLDATALGAPAGDMSVWSLFMQADLVVKLVMIGLILASVWTWAIAFEKFMLFRRTRSRMNQFESLFWSGHSLDELYRSLASRTTHAMEALFVAAMREWKRSYESGANSPGGVQSRIGKVMDVTIARETGRLESRLLFLASVGASAPFIGLFGTVWGIMNSFRAIAVAESTNLAVVAPGIAEALFATALGLFAAIPAVIFYNKFSNEVTQVATRLEGFADEFTAILSRQLDERI